MRKRRGAEEGLKGTLNAVVSKGGIGDLEARGTKANFWCGWADLRFAAALAFPGAQRETFLQLLDSWRVCRRHVFPDRGATPSEVSPGYPRARLVDLNILEECTEIDFMHVIEVLDVFICVELFQTCMNTYRVRIIVACERGS